MKKHLFRFSSLLLGIALFSMILSCKKDKEETKQEITNPNLIGKWNISDKKSAYSSIEFTSDKDYIIVTNEEAGGGKLNTGINLKTHFGNTLLSSFKNAKTNLSQVHYGTFKMEGNKITLSGFGLINVISLTEEEFHFSFTIQSTGNTNEYVASKTKNPISSSTKTDLFCRTWIIEKVTMDIANLDEEEIEFYEDIYGPEWVSLLEEEINQIVGSVVLFSKAGTYLVIIDDEAFLSEWKWKNSSENEFYYSHDNWEDDWLDNNITKIKELNNNKLVVSENEYTSDNEYITHLVIKE
jgi:hypothetical protein